MTAFMHVKLLSLHHPIRHEAEFPELSRAYTHPMPASVFHEGADLPGKLQAHGQKHAAFCKHRGFYCRICQQSSCQCSCSCMIPALGYCCSWKGDTHCIAQGRQQYAVTLLLDAHPFQFNQDMPWSAAAHKVNNFRGSIYMVFDYMDHDLTGLMERKGYKFTVPQVRLCTLLSG